MINDIERENWTSRIGFILAAAGSAVGLGNIWRFPYITGENGGAVFLVIYLIAIVLIGYPIMITEISIGRKSQKNPVGAFKELAPDTPWWLVGALGVLSGFVILSFYSVVGGWSMAYIVEALKGFSADTDFAVYFGDLISGTSFSLFWHFIFMVLTILIIGAGVVNGIQKVVKLLMPILIILLGILVLRSITLQGAAEGLSFYLKPDFGDLSWGSLGDVIGQAFFTLSLGMGAMLTYGSYLNKDDSITDSAGYIVGLDTLIAFIAGLAIFPAVFALGMDPTEGAGLVFVVLPAVFAEMPWGSFFGFLFFLLLSIAALTSAISLLEVVTAWLIDEKGWARKKAAYVIGFVIFLMGIPTLLGEGVWSDVQILNMGIMDFYDWISNSIFLPLGGMLTAIFAGHVWTARNAAQEANRGDSVIKVGEIYGLLIKYILPVVIFIILIMKVVSAF